MRTKILRNIFISVGVSFALGQLLSAGTNEGALNFGNMPLAGHPPTITTFDAPGAGTGSGQGTLSFCINPRGTIAAGYIDAINVFHGFVRGTNDTFITFSAPGAGTGFHEGTEAVGINPMGAVAGLYADDGAIFHGFVRATDGAISTFDVPGAGTGPGQGTSP